jgi:type I restriction enzyme M protein
MPWGRPRKTEGAAPAPAEHKDNGANLGFEAQLFLAADKLRKNVDPSDSKRVALGLIFLKHISNAFAAKRAALPNAVSIVCRGNLKGGWNAFP